jgi:hypothetical protein
MKALLTAFALLSFVAASTLPMTVSAQEMKGDQTMSKPDNGMSSEKGATSSHKAANHKSKKKTSKKKSHHKSSAKKSKSPETTPAPKEG